MKHYNIGLERAILSGCFMNETVRPLEELSNECFYLPDHKRIRNMLLELEDKGHPINAAMIPQTMLDDYNINEESMLEVFSASPTSVTDQVKAMMQELADKRKVDVKLRELLVNLSKYSSVEISRMMETSAHELIERQLEKDDSTFGMISIDEITETPVDFIGKDFVPLPRKAATLLVGRGGVGKTGVALQMAMRHIQATGEKVFCWFSEDPLGETRQRTEQLCRQLGITMQTLHNKLIVSNARPFNVAIHADGDVISNPDLAKLKELTKDFGMIVLDPLRSFASNFDENSNSDMDNVTKEFATWAKKEDKAILLIHHASKDGDVRGASSIVDAARLAYMIKVPDGNSDGIRTLSVAKDNFGVSKILGASSIKIPTLA